MPEDGQRDRQRQKRTAALETLEPVRGADAVAARKDDQAAVAANALAHQR